MLEKLRDKYNKNQDVYHIGEITENCINIFLREDMDASDMGLGAWEKISFDDLFFNHKYQFCKAFFGEEYTEGECRWELDWQYHIKQLALSEDRLEYIGSFL